MTKLWLTYAWVDNEAEEVDFIAQQLRSLGIDVHLDRTHLVRGQRLWPQLADAISNPAKTDALAFYVTENSLRSEPCREELNYALTRTLDARTAGFPIIGIFPRKISPELIPPAIRSRIYVHLTESDWDKRILEAAIRVPPGPGGRHIAPFHLAWVKNRGGQYILEVRPRAGRWYPFIFLLKEAERVLLQLGMHGPSGEPPAGSMTSTAELRPHEGYSGIEIHQAVDATMSAYLVFSGLPSQVVFGQRGQMYSVERAGNW
ncbi:toll/interleukin-1 receptor domain-containing protein [Mesorhizobium sp. B1-1-7]|uniref:toll/interleukin-1 receptor domain-containing protein n=1 Tax=Mesorhizobium sp. B1-1-7 TaxID=2589977 RepID=UPI0015E2BED9|nr:toll/interleukin-1 receptor domain-containing protein [Mesorhizobium sp. B1-1-7]